MKSHKLDGSDLGKITPAKIKRWSRKLDKPAPSNVESSKKELSKSNIVDIDIIEK